MQRLLDVIDDTLLEVVGVVTEEPDFRRGFLDNRLTPRSYRPKEVIRQQPDDARLIFV